MLSDLLWDEPVTSETPKLSVANYNKDVAAKGFFSIPKLSGGNNASVKIFCDLNRICEIEDAVEEWYEEAYYRRKSDIYDLSFLKENFRIKEILYAGVDGAICKVLAEAINPGVIEKKRLGLEIYIKSRHEELVNEVKRLGYIMDRQSPL